MAEIPTEAVKFLVEKLIALASEEVGLILGFKNELKKLEQTLRMVQAFLVDASTRQTGNDQAVKLWLQKLEDVAYEADNLLDEFNYEIIRRKVEIPTQIKRKVCCFFSFSAHGDVVFRREMGHKIKDLNMKLKSINDEASSFGLQSRAAQLPAYVPLVIETNSITFDAIFIGRGDVELSIIEDMTVKSSNELVVSVVPILGMGGLGKTTLARKVFNHPSVENHFKERIWVSLSKSFDSKGLFVKILESLAKDSVDASLGEEAVLGKLKSKLKDARYLLVLDDYLDDTNTKQNWESFMGNMRGINGNRGNFIIVTTRNQDVASIVNTKTDIVDSLNSLSADECWSIIKARAFPGESEVPHDIKAIGKEIALGCGGLPLAANVIGGTLKGKGMDDWISFRDKSGSLRSNPEDNFILQVLKISFDRLPSPLLKKCFTYCSIFRKGEEIERKRLIQLWMAEGFLTGYDEHMDMESVGDNVYNILLQNFFLHEAVKDDFGRVSYSKMHDLVHDLSCLVAKANPVSSKDVTPRVRYLVVADEKQEIGQEQTINLRTLIAHRGKVEFINNIFQDCKSLRVLDLQWVDIEELTSSIDKLMHLRFLDLSYTHIKRLPASVCKLFNLQTLRLGGCDSLEELPDQLKCLVGLRHLVTDHNHKLRMPCSIGKLTSLRTLNLFTVSNEEGRRIDELRYLKNLQGKLKILNLENVNGKEESLGACLSEKENVEKLKFVWERSSSSVNNNDYEVLEGLRPHPNLKDLGIIGFGGDRFPSWTMTLNKLVKIFLEGCEKCQEIPTLGHLQHLKILVVKELKKVRSIGDSFYIPRQYTSSDESSRHGVPFPALESFGLRDMENLIEWVEAPNTGATAFPRLKHLEIMSCSQMKTAPSHGFPSLETLDISDSKIPLDKICSQSNSLTGLFITRNPNVTSLPDMLFHNNQSLQRVLLWHCENLTKVQLPSQLRSLFVDDCYNLASIENLKSCSASLEVLKILGCPKMRSLNGMDCLVNLVSLELGPLSKDFTWSNVTFRGLHQLRELSLFGNWKCESLPNELQHLTALTDLSLSFFGIEALPEWFNSTNFSNLQKLYLFSCNKLRDVSCLQHLTNLKELYIRWCSVFEETFNIDQSSSRAHISHIPRVLVGGRRVEF